MQRLNSGQTPVPPLPRLRGGVAEHDQEDEAAELEDGSLDPDEASSSAEPWDEGADDET